VLQLDKNIYGELVTDQSSLQKSIAIWLSGSIMLDFQTLIIEVEEGFESINNVNSLITTQLFGFINVVVSVLISLALQGIVLVATSIFSLVCLGSGLKQVYMLRNIEVILLILFSGFSSLVAM